MIVKTALVAALILSSASMGVTAAQARTHRGHWFHSRNVALSYAHGSARGSWMSRASRNWSGGGY
jgi:hypothetical protein